MVACLCHEFNEKIIGAKVDKIYQPSKDELLFSMRAGARAEKLLLSCASNSPMVCLTEEKFENPLTAPMLCMLLRKHLAGGRLLSVSQEGGFKAKIELDVIWARTAKYRERH